MTASYYGVFTPISGKPGAAQGFGDLAEREGLTPLHFIPLRLCGVRFAGEMIFRYSERGSQTRCFA